MKHIITLLAFSVFFGTSYAQAPKAQLFASYQYYHQFDATEAPQLDSVTLHINLDQQVSLYNNISYERRTSGDAQIEDDDYGIVVTKEISFSDGQGYPIYTNHKQQLIYERRIALDEGKKKPFIVVDSDAKIQWVLKEEFRSIGRFNCQKAESTFRGRTYIAWFDRSIPSSIGPWKLHGLPGLIIEVSDESNQVAFAISSLAYPTPHEHVLSKPSSGEEISLQTYLAIEDRTAENYVAYLKSRLPRGSNVKVTSITKTSGLEIDYGFD